MSSPLSPEREQEIRGRATAATPGPWVWCVNTQCRDVYLATARWGRYSVMQFGRWGMNGAQPRFRDWGNEQHTDRPAGGIMRDLKEIVPHGQANISHPDAVFIEHARQDVDDLLAEIDRLRSPASSSGIECGELPAFGAIPDLLAAVVMSSAEAGRSQEDSDIADTTDACNALLNGVAALENALKAAQHDRALWHKNAETCMQQLAAARQQLSTKSEDAAAWMAVADGLKQSLDMTHAELASAQHRAEGEGFFFTAPTIDGHRVITQIWPAQAQLEWETTGGWEPVAIPHAMTNARYRFAMPAPGTDVISTPPSEDHKSHG